MIYKIVANQYAFNGRVLNNEADHDTILRILDDKINRAGRSADPFTVALTAVAEVRVAAVWSGWTRGNAEKLATYAALVYGALLKDAADDLRIGR